jgi:hypothetical protein
MTAAAPDRRAQTRAGVRAVLWFSSDDPRRGRVLFTGARANSVLADRRATAEDLLFQRVIEHHGRMNEAEYPVASLVAAALYAGALTELVQQWLLGRLGSDLDSVVDYALAGILPRR